MHHNRISQLNVLIKKYFAFFRIHSPDRLRMKGSLTKLFDYEAVICNPIAGKITVDDRSLTLMTYILVLHYVFYVY
jgi:hypothetical protein